MPSYEKMSFKFEVKINLKKKEIKLPFYTFNLTQEQKKLGF